MPKPKVSMVTLIHAYVHVRVESRNGRLGHIWLKTFFKKSRAVESEI